MGRRAAVLIRLAIAAALLHVPPVRARDLRFPRIDPSPYDHVGDVSTWRGAHRTLAFALLGRCGEPRERVIAVYESTSVGWTRRFLDHERGFHPWAVRVAELDGDSLPEVAVGVYKTSRFDPVLRRRLFVFDWTCQNVLAPKWLGSRLAGPFTTFRFVPARNAGRSCLVTIDAQDPCARPVTYRWNGFGFSLVPPPIHDRGELE